jgi:uncharacterized phage protein (TIGR02218 family)
MRPIPPALLTHINEEATTLAACIRITRADAEVFAFTEHDRELTVSGQTYKPLLGERSKVAAAEDLSIPNFDVAAVIDDDDLTEDDLASGLFDSASCELFLVNWQSPGDGTIPILKGSLGEVQRAGAAFTADLRGLMDRLAQAVGEKTSPSCRFVLGDENTCKADLTNFTTTGQVEEVTDRRTFTASFANLPTGGPPPDSGFFDNAGVLTWTSGANSGRKHLVRRHEEGGSPGSALQLYLPAYHDIGAGDTFSVHAGCDHIITGHCRTRFDNVPNFGGEPHVPGVNVGLLPQTD